MIRQNNDERIIIDACRYQLIKHIADHPVGSCCLEHESLVSLCNQLQLFLLDVSTTSDLLETLQTGLGLKR